MKLQFFSLIMFTCLHSLCCNAMQPYKLPPACKKITARKMLASPYREIYADVLQEHAIPRKSTTTTLNDSVMRCTADMLKNETVQALERVCGEKNPTPFHLKNSLIEERLHEEIVMHLTNLGNINEQEQRLLVSLYATDDKQEKKTLKRELKEVRFRLKVATIQLHIIQQAEMLRETTLFLQKEKNRHNG